MPIRRPGAMTIKKARRFSIQDSGNKTEDGEEVRNSLLVSFEEGSVTGEEFPILNEEYESGE